MKITVQARREDALKAGFLSLAGRINLGFEDFCAQLADWRVLAFCDGERAVGMLLLRGPELHVAVLPEVRGRWLSRRLIREVFAPIIAKGEPVMKVAPDNPRGLEFVQRLREGFASGRFDPTTILTSVGGSLLSGALQGGAAESAANTAAAAQNQATDTQKQIFDTQNQQQAPYRQAGTSVLGSLTGGLGVPATQQPQIPITKENFNAAAYLAANPDVAADPYFSQHPWEHYDMFGRNELAAGGNNRHPYAMPGQSTPSADGSVNGIPLGQFTHQFDANDLKTNLAPNYDFVKQQGIGATTNLLNATGSTGGNTLKGITDYATNLAGNAYQNAFANYTTNQNNIFSRLSTVAGLGTAANQQGAQLAGTLAPSIAQTQVGAGQAQAAGTVGAANALAGGGSNALGWYQLGNLMNSGGNAGQVQPMVPGQFSMGTYG